MSSFGYFMPAQNVDFEAVWRKFDQLSPVVNTYFNTVFKSFIIYVYNSGCMYKRMLQTSLVDHDVISISEQAWNNVTLGDVRSNLENVGRTGSQPHCAVA